MSHTSIENWFVNHNNYRGSSPVKRPVSRWRLMLLSFMVGSLLTWLFAPNAHAAPKDPFAGDTWHAAQKSWPGTLRFDGKTKTVTLQPLGGRAITAKYTFRIPPRAKGTSPKMIEGVLDMKTTQGETSQATFQIDNKGRHPALTLTFPNGAVEHYERMTPAQEAAETARLRKQMGL